MIAAHWAHPTEIDKKIAIVLFLTLIYHPVPSGAPQGQVTNAVVATAWKTCLRCGSGNPSVRQGIDSTLFFMLVENGQ